MTGGTFRQNRAGSDGGGRFNDDHATVAGTSFGLSQAGSDGGAIYQAFAGDNDFGLDMPMLSITRGQVRGNFAAADGGGIDNTVPPGWSGFGGPVTVARSTVVGNTASGAGGGIGDFGGGPVSLSGSVVTSNHRDNCAPASAIPGCTG